jgi:hypothetical protein
LGFGCTTGLDAGHDDIDPSADAFLRIDKPTFRFCIRCRRVRLAIGIHGRIYLHPTRYAAGHPGDAGSLFSPGAQALRLPAGAAAVCFYTGRQNRSGSRSTCGYKHAVVLLARSVYRGVERRCANLQSASGGYSAALCSSYVGKSLGADVWAASRLDVDHGRERRLMVSRPVRSRKTPLRRGSRRHRVQRAV